METASSSGTGCTSKTNTKLAGELAIRESGAPHLIFPTAWVYVTRDRNFLLTILHLASQREELRIIHDQIGAPTWCREIARAATSILEHLSQDGRDVSSFPQVSGTYHMTAGGVASWYDFAQAMLAEASKAPVSLSWLASATGGRPRLARRIAPINTAEYPTPARRAAYSVLSNARLSRRFGVQLPNWREQLHSGFSASLPL
jgi:dTDP-4-dehydrorhamnose reductase